MGVIFGVEEFLQIFTKFWNINVSHRRILCAIFTKFSLIVGSFILDHVLKLGEIRYRGSGQNWGLNLWGSSNPQIYSVPFSDSCASDPNVFGGARTCSRSPITVPSLFDLRHHMLLGEPKMLSFCLTVCPSTLHCPWYRNMFLAATFL